MDGADELGVGKNGSEPVEDRLAENTADGGTDRDGDHGPGVDLRLPAHRILGERRERHHENGDARKKAHRAHAHNPHGIDDGLDDHPAADSAERTQKRGKEAYDEDRNELQLHFARYPQNQNI